MATCEHAHFKHELKMKWVAHKEYGVRQLMAQLRVWCSDCGEPYTFHGDVGFSTIKPCLSVDETELRIPLDVPAEDDEPTPETFLH